MYYCEIIPNLLDKMCTIVELFIICWARHVLLWNYSQGDTKTVSSSPSQLAFVRVFCGPSAQVRFLFLSC